MRRTKGTQSWARARGARNIVHEHVYEHEHDEDPEAGPLRRSPWSCGIPRRLFLGMLAVSIAPVAWVANRGVPARFVEAVRLRVYPGAVARLDPSELNNPGKWGG